jgi:hypothetical protein
VAVGVLLTSVIEFLRDRRGLERERRRELKAAAYELANSANSIGHLMSLFAAMRNDARALDWAEAYLPHQERRNVAAFAIRRLAPPASEAADRVRRAAMEVSAEKLLAAGGETYASSIIATVRAESNNLLQIVNSYLW